MLLLRYAKFVEAGTPAQRLAAAEAAVQYLTQPGRHPDLALLQEFARRAGRGDITPVLVAANERASLHADQLARDLNVARAHQLRDDTYKYYVAQGVFACERGNLPESESCFLSAREYCASSAATVECHLTLAQLAVMGGDYGKSGLQLSKVEGVAELALDGNPDRVHALRGVYDLNAGAYEDAAREMLGMGAAGPPAQLLHADDAALIGGLCALATYSREELKSGVLMHPRGKAHVDKHADLRNAMNSYVDFKFDRMRAALLALKPVLAVDYFACAHVDTLLRIIMQRAMEAYLIPYSTIKLDAMARAFGIEKVEELTKELSDLIRQERIQARIDSVAKTLVSHTATPRAVAYERVLATARQMQTDARILLLRASMEKAKLAVREQLVPAGGSSMFHPSSAAMAAASSAPLQYNMSSMEGMEA